MGTEPVDDFRFVAARRRMIETIRSRGIEDLELLRLFDEVPRHRFLPAGVHPRAYEDAPLPIGFGQTASQPSLQAWFLKILEVQSDERVLEIGTGSGFFAALLARLAEHVYSVERVRELSVRARPVLDEMGFQNVALMVGDGTIGWRKHAPFDVITVAAASPSVPGPLVEQLGPGGRLLLPVGSREEQDLVLVTRDAEGRVEEGTVQERCTFVPLLGKYGWKESSSER